MANHADAVSSVDELRLAVALADHGSMLAAAASLHIAQPSASQRLRRLESRVGLALFDRDTRGTRPTAAGLEYVRLARRALETIESVTDGARRAAGRPRSRSGTFTSLSVPVFTAVQRLLPPPATVEQRIGNGRLLLQMMDGGELDASVIIAPHATWAPATSDVTQLGSDPLLLVAASGVEAIASPRERRRAWPLPVWLATYSSQPDDVAQDFAAMGAHVRLAGSAPVALAIARERGELAAVPRTAWSADRRPGEHAQALPGAFSMPLALVTTRTSPLSGRGGELATELGLA
ncbi:LysR family transcriptional regulator [Occultella aeris]|uniref:HTH-type transcriptional regulator CynR n=1 Tax=Occultella aeris TaxID=2761496 RepID=A0A7M4DIB4_9MICO|nr:LysR family transcriptional regulator [Occultella aeris]VZO36685.1 HTH-type transcriptional regulator CynR [Occultella aeris]